MKKRIIGAVIIAVLALIAYPFLEVIATAERGYNAIGGEEFVVVSAGAAACLLILDGIGGRKAKEKSDSEAAGGETTATGPED